MTEHQLHLLKIWKCSGSCLAPGDEEEEDPIPRVALGKVGRALGSRIRDSPCSLPLWIQQSYNTVTGISLFNKKNHWIIIDFLYTFPLADRQMLGNPGHLPAEIVITEKKRKEKKRLSNKDVWSTQIRACLCSDTDDARISQEKVGRELPGQMSKVIAVNVKILLSH